MWHDIRTLNTITRAMLGVLVLCLLFAGYRWLSLQPFFDLRVVKVQSANGASLRYVDAATVRSAALPRLRGNFFTADLGAVRAAFETVPWVQRASVRREWPNKLIVSVDEYEALGTWGEQDDRLLSVDGYLFTANMDEAESEGRLPQLAGPENSAHEVAERLIDLRVWLAPVKLAPRTLTLSKRYAWTAKLSNGVTLKLGRVQDREALKRRIDRFVLAYPRLSAQLAGRIESVDMRYPNGLAYRMRGPSPISTPAVREEDAA
ncbi:MAG: cell division protein FtsQ/DivIB [Oxalobacteraceae bacterium]